MSARLLFSSVSHPCISDHVERYNFILKINFLSRQAMYATELDECRAFFPFFDAANRWGDEMLAVCTDPDNGPSVLQDVYRNTWPEVFAESLRNGDVLRNATNCENMEKIHRYLALFYPIAGMYGGVDGILRTLFRAAMRFFVRRWQNVRIIQHSARHMVFGVCADGGRIL